MPPKIKRLIEESIDEGSTHLELVSKDIEEILRIPYLFSDHSFSDNLVKLTLSHNKIRVLPKEIAILINLEHLNCFNNHLVEICQEITQLNKLKILNLGMNRLSVLPKGFGAFPNLEIIDLSYNNLSEKSLPNNFFELYNLRALYLGDNDFEIIPVKVQLLINLQIISFRHNDLIQVPPELKECQSLREVHLQGNRLMVLPPEFGCLDLTGSKTVVRLEFNPWVELIADQLQIGPSHVMEYLKTDAYRHQYQRFMDLQPKFPAKADKSKKTSRKVN